MKQDRSPGARTGLEVVEEAVALLRRAPASAWAVYAAGTGGFLIAALYFLANLSAGPNDTADAVGQAAGVAVLFGFAKVGQCYFCNHLHALLQHRADPPWTGGRIARCFLQQCAVQPWGFLALFVASLVVLPFARVFGWFESQTLYADGLRSPGEASRLASRAAATWPGQNHSGLFILGLFGLVMLGNLIAALQFLPDLVRSVFGYELPIARVGYNFFNTTFLAAFAAATFLIVDPVIKAFYVVRAAHAEARETGADLLAFLRRWQAVALWAICAGGLLLPGQARGEPPAPTPVVTAPEVDAAIDHVLARDEFRWKMPRSEKGSGEMAEESGALGFFQALGRWFADATRDLLRWLGEILRFIGQWFSHFDGETPTLPSWEFGWLGWVRAILYLLLAAGVIALLFLVIRRMWKKPRSRAVQATPDRPPVLPDLAEESLRADALPEDGWLALARAMVEKGEWRLATRAFYLAALAHLAGQTWISVGRAKTNGQYLQEFRRRARGQSERHTELATAIHEFESVWYGSHPVDPDFVRAFESRSAHIRHWHA